jgi:hypothetical protein
VLGSLLEQLDAVGSVAEQLHRRAARLEDGPTVGRGIAAEYVFEVQPGVKWDK